MSRMLLCAHSGPAPWLFAIQRFFEECQPGHFSAGDFWPIAAIAVVKRFSIACCEAMYSEAFTALPA